MKTEYYFHTKEQPRTTVCGILDPQTATFTLAKATCGPNDTFEKKIGRNLAKGRIEQAERIRSKGRTVEIRTVQVDPTLTEGQAFVAAALEFVNSTLIEA